MSRQQDRQSYTEPTRLSLLEGDADTVERGLRRLEEKMTLASEQLERTVDSKVEELRKTVVGVQRVLIGILVSLATASVLLAINIGVAGR